MLTTKSYNIEDIIIKSGSTIIIESINKEDIIRQKDIKDAFNYLSIITNDTLPYEIFISILDNSTIEDIPITLLSGGFQGDNGRRPKADSRLENPIIVIHTGDNRYIIADGNHRYRQKIINNDNTIKGVILEIPELKKKKSRSGYTYFN